MFFIRNIDFILIWIILILIFNYLKFPSINFIGYLLWVAWFYIWFIQYRKKLELDLITDFFKDNWEKSIKKFIDSFLIVSPILIDQRNFITILKREVDEVIWSVENKDELIKWLQEKLFQVKQNSSYDLLISIMKENKKLNENLIDRLKDKKLQKDVEGKITYYNALIELLESTQKKLLKDITLKNKLLIFFNPNT